MKKVLLYDTDHAHQESLTMGRYPKKFEWTREDFDTDMAFYTNRKVFINTTKKYNIGIITEPKSIMSDVYMSFNSLIDKFDQIYTHNSKLLQHPKCKWIPGNGVWFNSNISNPKTKHISMLVSNKRMTQMHHVRADMAAVISKHNLADVMGTYNGPRVPTEAAFSDYRFNVCIENDIDYSYFTEKLTNCFASKTIPIYLGASKEFLLKYFDGDGIIYIEKLADIPFILSGLTEEDYNKRLHAVEYNYQAVQKFLSLDDYIYDNIWSKDDLYRIIG